MARIGIWTVALSASLVLTGAVPASTIVGTARNDTLRGTPKADKLYGKAGNDRLFGFRGNDQLFGGAGNDRLVGGAGDDRLVGGAGADRLVCGPGRDIAVRDARDTVAKDCEIVKGRKPAPQPPPAVLGSYCGSTSQGLPVCFEVAVGSGPTTRAIRRMRLAVQAECEPTRQLTRSLVVDTLALVNGDRTFHDRTLLSVLSSDFQGAFDRAGTSASGSLSVQFTEEVEGIQYACDSGLVSWQAKTPPPIVSAQPGTFCGLSDQGLEFCFDVAGTPKTVTNLKLLVRVQCAPEATFGVSSTIPTAYAIREDGGFSFRRRGSKTEGEGSFTVEHAMDGTFDASGTSVAGTLSAHVSYDAPDGTHYECDSGEFAWSTRRQ